MYNDEDDYDRWLIEIKQWLRDTDPDFKPSKATLAEDIRLLYPELHASEIEAVAMWLWDIRATSPDTSIDYAVSLLKKQLRPPD